jgi:hypothetical protein
MRKLDSIFILLIACLLFIPSVRGDEKSGEEKRFKAVISNDGVQHVDIVGAAISSSQTIS